MLINLMRYTARGVVALECLEEEANGEYYHRPQSGSCSLCVITGYLESVAHAWGCRYSQKILSHERRKWGLLLNIYYRNWFSSSNARSETTRPHYVCHHRVTTASPSRSFALGLLSRRIQHA